MNISPQSKSLLIVPAVVPNRYLLKDWVGAGGDYKEVYIYKSLDFCNWKRRKSITLEIE